MVQLGSRHQKHRMGKRSGPANVGPLVPCFDSWRSVHPKLPRVTRIAPSPASGEWLAWWEGTSCSSQEQISRKWKEGKKHGPSLFSLHALFTSQHPVSSVLTSRSPRLLASERLQRSVVVRSCHLRSKLRVPQVYHQTNWDWFT